MSENRRRDTGGKRASDGLELKNVMIALGVILVLGLIVFFVTIKIYNSSLDKVYNDLDVAENGDDTVIRETEEASSQIGKTLEEAQNEAQETSVENEEVQEVSSQANDRVEVNNEEEPVQEQKNEEKVLEEEIKEEPATEDEPVFERPVEGEIMKEFAQDKLVYSETLKEWVVHTGVDIKADKTTVVKAAESGKVIAIKNDPRYGITVIIEHSNGYETRYANLLTAEFVNVGEEVTKGQTIGTVGNTATFEVVDDFHLHFEILKDGKYQDPIFFINF